MTTPSEAPPRILIVDDDEDVVSRLTQLLEDDYEVLAASDWAELNSIFFRQGCDLVLMDVNLPVLRGDKLVDVLRRTSANSAHRPRIVYFSSEDEQTMRRLVEETEADGFISKSLRSVQILAAIRTQLKKALAGRDPAGAS